MLLLPFAGQVSVVFRTENHGPIVLVVLAAVSVLIFFKKNHIAQSNKNKEIFYRSILKATSEDPFGPGKGVVRAAVCYCIDLIKHLQREQLLGSVLVSMAMEHGYGLIWLALWVVKGLQI